MNREIKFRGKRIDLGEWVYGSLLIGFTGITYIVTMHDHILGMTTMHEVDEKTVGQYTVLKDKNGKEIYEGDIVRLEQWRPSINEVLFNRGGFCFRSSKDDTFYPDGKYLEEGEVIGNIYDHPELLK